MKPTPPPPSQKALEKILTTHLLIEQDNIKELTGYIMAWATGQPRRWCSEISYHHDAWWFEPSSEPNAGTHPVPSTWIVCPICNTSRPAES